MTGRPDQAGKRNDRSTTWKPVARLQRHGIISRVPKSSPAKRGRGTAEGGGGGVAGRSLSAHSAGLGRAVARAQTPGRRSGARPLHHASHGPPPPSPCDGGGLRASEVLTREAGEGDRRRRWRGHGRALPLGPQRWARPGRRARPNARSPLWRVAPPPPLAPSPPPPPLPPRRGSGRP